MTTARVATSVLLLVGLVALASHHGAFGQPGDGGTTATQYLKFEWDAGQPKYVQTVAGPPAKYKVEGKGKVKYTNTFRPVDAFEFRYYIANDNGGPYPATQTGRYKGTMGAEVQTDATPGQEKYERTVTLEYEAPDWVTGVRMKVVPAAETGGVWWTLDEAIRYITFGTGVSSTP